MITSLSDLDPAARQAAQTYLTASTAGLPAALRTEVIADLTAHLCEHLDAAATVADVEALADDLGPLPEEPTTAHRLWQRLSAGFSYHDADGRIARTWWNPSSDRLLLPRAIGWGWDLNLGAVAVRLGLIEPDAEAEPFTATPESAFAVAAAVPVTLAGATVLHYLVRGRSLPQRLPAHWDAVGRPTRWTSKRRAAASDLASTVIPAAVAVLAARKSPSDSTGPQRAGAIAGAGMIAAVGASVTVARSLGGRRQPLFGPGVSLLAALSAGTVLVWLARAGRAAEIATDLETD